MAQINLPKLSLPEFERLIEALTEYVDNAPDLQSYEVRCALFRSTLSQHPPYFKGKR